MGVFSKNLEAIIKDRDIMQKDFADSIEVTAASVSNWLRKGMVPSMEILEQICDKYHISYDDLMSDEYGYFAKTHGGIGEQRDILPPRQAHAPLYGTVHAGEEQEPELIDDRIPIPYEVWQGHKNGYFLQVVGDCMDKVYPPGCFVLVDPDIQPQSGSIGVVAIDGTDYVMRRLYKGASVLVLSPESHNTEWLDTIVDSSHEVKLIGTVVWFQPAEELA